MSVMPSPAATGRGAWSKRGNIKGKTMYFAGCSAGLASCDTQDKWAVNRGVWAAQIMLGKAGFSFDYYNNPGVFGPLTDKGVRDFQTAQKLASDGILGPATSKALLRKFVADHERVNGVPDRLLWGQIGAETNWDMGAIGYSTPYDLGICQFNTYYNQSLSADQIMNPTFVIPISASRLRTRYNEYRAYTTDVRRAWDAAVLAHNSPTRAKIYAKTGVYPTDQSRIYVERVRAAATVV